MIKRWMWVVLTLILAMSLVLAGCGGSDKKAADSKAPDKIIIKIAYENNPGEPVDTSVKEWARLLKEKSKGKAELQLYPSSQLGSKKDLMEQMKLGSNVITIGDGAFFADYVPDFGILMGPYLADDVAQMMKLTKSQWFADLSKKLEGKGFHIVASNWLYGTRHTVASKPFATPAEMQGMKIRVPNNKVQMESLKAMGATPTPMPLGEVYPALTQGVINGAENPIPVLYGQKHHEPTKNLVLTGHIINVTQWFCGQGYWEKLPADVQKALLESGEEAGVFMTNLAEKSEKEATEKMVKEGTKVHKIDTKAFKEATKVVYTKFPDWTPGLYDTVQAIMKK